MQKTYDYTKNMFVLVLIQLFYFLILCRTIHFVVLLIHILSLILFYLNLIRSIAVVSVNGYRLFQLASVDNVKEIYCSNNEETKIAERLFSSSLVATVTTADPKILKVKMLV